MKTSEPIKCFLSEKGHKNFWYPTSTKVIVSKGCEYEKLNWISGSGRKLCAIKVRKECIVPLQYEKASINNTSPPEENSYIVVWTDKTIDAP